MKLNELTDRVSLKAAGLRAGLEVRVVKGHLDCMPLDADDPRYSLDLVLPSMCMVERCRADVFDFFLPLIDAGWLTEGQMRRAADRYMLGRTRSGKPLFWMIDDLWTPLDGHIGQDGWVSTLLKAREPLLACWRPRHCLFGLHLLTERERHEAAGKGWTDGQRDSYGLYGVGERRWADQRPVGIVEREATAVVLSELFPQVTWMAYAALPLLSVELFAPLVGCNVTIYPNVELSTGGFDFFLDFAATVRRCYNIRIAVDDTLERYATEAMREQGADLVGMIRRGPL